MGFLGRRTRGDRPTTAGVPEAVLDDGDRARLLAAGESDVVRTWSHFWYCDDERDAERVVPTMRERGWRITRMARAVDASGWVIVATRDDVVTPAVIRSTRAFFAGLAARVAGGEYDGWEFAGSGTSAIAV
jgi:hypothetical protein